MAKTLQFRRDTTANLASVTGSVGEIFIDTTKDTVVVMDGSTAGGFPLQKELVAGSGINITGNTISATGGGGDYGNTQVAVYLPTYSGNIANVTITGTFTTNNLYDLNNNQQFGFEFNGIDVYQDLVITSTKSLITTLVDASGIGSTTPLRLRPGSSSYVAVQKSTGANVVVISGTTGNVTFTNNVSISGNTTTGGILTDNYFYANGTPISFGGGGGASVFNFAGNTNITSCVSGTGGSGSNSFFVGNSAGLSVTTGSNNIFIGNSAGQSMTNQSNNFFAGDRAGFSGTGSRNVFIGAQAGCRNIGTNNNFIGDCAGRSAASGAGSYNNFFGKNAGLVNNAGSNNNFFGFSAGLVNTFGGDNNFIGEWSGSQNTTGCHNNFIGAYAGNSNISGIHNNFFGHNAGYNNDTGNNNIFIGRNAGTTSFSPTGLVDITTECNRIVLGNADHACAQIQIAWTVVSDCRDKYIFGAVPHGRGFLQNINPVEFAFKDRTTGNIVDPNGKRRYGFLAQEILSAEGDSPVIVSTEDPDKLQMTNDYLVPVLVNAVNELSAEIETLKNRILTLESK